jgi:hypothetical protein
MLTGTEEPPAQVGPATLSNLNLMPVGKPAGPGTGTRMSCSVMAALASHLANSDEALIMQNASLIPS